MAGGYGSGPGGGAGGGLLDEGSISGAGTVMSQMRALFTPPGRDARRHQQYLELAGTSVELHPYYRRPGTNLNIYDGMRAHFQRFFFSGYRIGHVDCHQNAEHLWSRGSFPVPLF